MKLWHLRPVSDHYPAWDHAMAHGFVIRAATEGEARKMAEAVYQEKIWLDPEKTLCEKLTASGPAEVILTDYRVGLYEAD